jgi:hypothetical protein
MRSTPASSKKRKVEEATEDNAGKDWVVVEEEFRDAVTSAEDAGEI